MARTNNLTNFLTDVATAIKTKTGDSTAIPASQFDTKIADITTGKLTNEEYATADNDLDTILEGTTLTPVYPPNWSELEYTDTPQNIIEGFNYAKEILNNWDETQTSLVNKFLEDTNLMFMPVINTSNAKNMNGTFYRCSSLCFIPFLNTSAVTNMSTTFYECGALRSVPQFDTQEITTAFGMFSNCKSLKDVPVFNISKCTNIMNMFQSCPSLSNNSLNNIMAMCLTASVYSGTKTLKQLGLTSEQATTCQGLSNYSAFTAAGWTTGY